MFRSFIIPAREIALRPSTFGQLLLPSSTTLASQSKPLVLPRAPLRTGPSHDIRSLASWAHMFDIGEFVEEFVRPACPRRNDDVLVRSIARGVVIAHHGPNEDVIEDPVGVESMILSSGPNLPNKSQRCPCLDCFSSPGEGDANTPVVSQYHRHRLLPNRDPRDRLSRMMDHVVQQKLRASAMLVYRQHHQIRFRRRYG